MEAALIKNAVTTEVWAFRFRLLFAFIILSVLYSAQLSNDHQKWGQEILFFFFYKGNNQENSDAAQKAPSKMTAPPACRNLLCPRGYSEKEEGLQQFSSRATTMTTDIWAHGNHSPSHVLLKPANMDWWKHFSLPRDTLLLRAVIIKSVHNCLVLPVHPFY